jgi:two-component system phosphate regulon sensor histidine kinase PhoR
LVALSTLVGLVYSRRVLSENYAQIVREDLAARVHLAAGLVEREAIAPDDATAWDGLAKRLGSMSAARITLIALDGRVLGDSEVALGDLPTVDNHGHRPEVSDALHNGLGQAERMSPTLHRPMLYLAVRFVREGQPFGVVRAALAMRHVDAVAESLRHGVAVGALITILVALLVSMVAAQLGSRRTRLLTATATKMASGDLSARTRISGSDEFGKLGVALDQLAEGLSTTLQQLRSEHDRLNGVLSGMAEGVLVLDRDGRIALVNPALRAMSLIGQDVAGKAPIEVIRNAELSVLLERALTTHTALSGELDLHSPSTSRVLVRTQPLIGKEAGLVAVFVDVTDLRRLETLRRDFVANASHELRTPIASIHSAAETLVSGAGEQAETRGRFLDIILRNAKRMQQLVDDMLELSRLEARESHIAFKTIRPLQVLQQVFASMGQAAQRKEIQLNAELPDELQVLGDHQALEQIFLNLVDNAIKYCPERSQVVVRHERGDGFVKLLIADDGPGIESRHLARLFERFYRVDAGRARDVGGTGLGLAIVKHLAETMNGSVSVDSEVGRGTTFSVRLPSA